MNIYFLPQFSLRNIHLILVQSSYTYMHKSLEMESLGNKLCTFLTEVTVSIYTPIDKLYNLISGMFNFCQFSSFKMLFEGPVPWHIR